MVHTKVVKVNDNGTICLKTGAVEEMINLRLLISYTPANVPDWGEGNAVCHCAEKTKELD